MLQSLNQGLALFMAFTPACLAFISLAVSTDLEKVATAFPAGNKSQTHV